MKELTIKERTVVVTLREAKAQVELPVVMMDELQLLETALGAGRYNSADVFLRCAQVGLNVLLAEYTKTQLKQNVQAAAVIFKR